MAARLSTEYPTAGGLISNSFTNHQYMYRLRVGRFRVFFDLEQNDVEIYLIQEVKNFNLTQILAEKTVFVRALFSDQQNGDLRGNNCTQANAVAFRSKQIRSSRPD